MRKNIRKKNRMRNKRKNQSKIMTKMNNQKNHKNHKNHKKLNNLKNQKNLKNLKIRHMIIRKIANIALMIMISTGVILRMRKQNKLIKRMANKNMMMSWRTHHLS